MQIIARRVKPEKNTIKAKDILLELKEDRPILIHGRIKSKVCNYSEFYKNHIVMITLVKNTNISFVGILEDKALRQLEKCLKQGSEIYFSALKSKYGFFNFNSKTGLKQNIPVIVKQFYKANQ